MGPSSRARNEELIEPRTSKELCPMLRTWSTSGCGHPMETITQPLGKQLMKLDQLANMIAFWSPWRSPRHHDLQSSFFGGWCWATFMTYRKPPIAAVPSNQQSRLLCHQDQVSFLSLSRRVGRLLWHPLLAAQNWKTAENPGCNMLTVHRRDTLYARLK